MEFKIEKQEEKPLVERNEIILKITKTDKTPSNVQVQEALAKLTNKEKELIVIKKIHQKFGMRECVVSAYAYKNEEALKKFEPKSKTSKTKTEKPSKEPEAGAKTEVKQEEKPIEKPEEKESMENK